MKDNNTSALKRIREARGLTRKEVAERSGINFRSLQDYEQGHKDIASAKSDTLLRLSLTLGCSMEELLLPVTEGREDEELLLPLTESPPEHEKNQCRILTLYALLLNRKVNAIESYTICSPEYNVYGRWKMAGEDCYLTFCYDGELVRLPFPMDLSSGMIEWLKEVAGLKIDYYIRCKRFEAADMMVGGSDWDES